ncbi:hypothetical protein H5410_052314 [Solanum commersonii]|uniref:Uncharacterized protein n=1 Tax=Solanum commersonii TaxID=4109 RepID=A0A9J5X1V8_SOLCO|nr:hypothetical protein H5410_052314 [Solanum commersonii]
MNTNVQVPGWGRKTDSSQSDHGVPDIFQDSSAVNFQELSQPTCVSYNPEHEGPEPNLATQELEKFGDPEHVQHMPENSDDNLTAACDPLAEPSSGSSSSGTDTLMDSSQEG